MSTQRPSRASVRLWWALSVIALALLAVWPFAASAWDVDDALAGGISALLAAVVALCAALALARERRLLARQVESALTEMTATFAPSARATALATAHNTLSLSLIHIGSQARRAGEAGQDAGAASRA